MSGLIVSLAWWRRLAPSFWGFIVATFRVPTFNLAVGIWRNGSNVANPPDVATTGNLRTGNGGAHSGGTGVFALPSPLSAFLIQGVSLLALPKGTDVRGFAVGAAAWSDVIECPRGSGRYYAALFAEDVGKGFVNEYRLVVMTQLNASLIATAANTASVPAAWPAPTP